ncbi:hypothetical protein [Rhizobium ecuadorense]|uniref:hypothetical protein n=1 Tax=Rhizobium ecuadorense TaxID=1671795 RepID=UPI000A6B3662|nr:hypothetical protein [Rhizobium ecuadorense]
MNVIERSRQSQSNLKPAALAILCLGVVVAQIDTSVVNLAVQPLLPMALSFIAISPFSGSITERLGKRAPSRRGWRR